MNVHVRRIGFFGRDILAKVEWFRGVLSDKAENQSCCSEYEYNRIPCTLVRVAI